MSGRVSEDGLSEVIGFILILGLLVVVLSLYVTYVVPSEGRTHEIEQMDYIKQQFLDYKLSTDALWLNNQIGASISQSIRMGTGEATTSGMFGGFSLVSPVGSSGSVMVNPMERSERMHITATGVTQNNPSVFKVIDAPIIDSICPKSVDVGESDIVEIRGSGFGDLDKVEVYFNGRKIESGVTVNNNLITINVLSSFTTQAGIIHIYVKKPTGVRSNYGYLLIKKSTDNPVPVISSLDPDNVVISSGTPDLSVSVEGSGFIDEEIEGKSIVFVNNEFVKDADFDVVSSSSIIINNLDSYLDHESEGGSIIPSIVSITVVNPQPGGGSASKKLYVLPESTNEIIPEILGISPNHMSKGDQTIPSEIKIFGSGFVDGISEVFLGTQKISSKVATNLISISSSDLNPDLFNTPGEFLFSVRNGAKSSGSMEIKQGSLISNPPTTKIDKIHSLIENFYIKFVDEDYVDLYRFSDSQTMSDFQNGYYYGVQLYELNNDMTIQIKAVPKIVMSDRDIENDEQFSPDPEFPELDKYFFTYQTDLILNLYKGKVEKEVVNVPEITKVMENFVIKSNIQRREEIWFDLMNPAYGVVDYFKLPYEFEVTQLPDVDNTDYTNYPPIISGAVAPYYSIDYTLSSKHTIDSHIIDNALGGLEYNSKNYYYRSQQDFIYQNGGVFVEQPDGSYPLVLPPISISRDGDNLVVGITNIPVSGYDTVGGSSQVQVSSTLDLVNTFGLTPGLPNAKSVLLHIDPTTESNRGKWLTTLKAICENARSNGVPVAFSIDDSNYDSAWVSIEDDGSGIPMLNIRGGGHENDQDIILDLKTSEFSVSLNPVGKAVSIQ
ncbi:IPT/TIG domain-containing protein [Methanospirillum sp.]